MVSVSPVDAPQKTSPRQRSCPYTQDGVWFDPSKSVPCLTLPNGDMAVPHISSRNCWLLSQQQQQQPSVRGEKTVSWTQSRRKKAVKPFGDLSLQNSTEDQDWQALGSVMSPQTGQHDTDQQLIWASVIPHWYTHGFLLIFCCCRTGYNLIWSDSYTLVQHSHCPLQTVWPFLTVKQVSA